jgi:hypothetical protein
MTETRGRLAAAPRFGHGKGALVARQKLFLILAGVVLAIAMPGGAVAGDILGFTEEVSTEADGAATEPYIDIDRSDGTVLGGLAVGRLPRRAFG